MIRFVQTRTGALVTAMLLVLSANASAGLPAQLRSSDLYGLYVVQWGNDETALAYLVISPDGRAIPPKANDPGAPTLPGFHVTRAYLLKDPDLVLGDIQRFRFAQHRISKGGFSFRTQRFRGTWFVFSGRFGREDVEGIPDVPYIVGVLTEMKYGRVVRKKQVQFSHAVIL